MVSPMQGVRWIRPVTAEQIGFENDEVDRSNEARFCDCFRNPTERERSTVSTSCLNRPDQPFELLLKLPFEIRRELVESVSSAEAL